MAFVSNKKATSKELYASIETKENQILKLQSELDDKIHENNLLRDTLDGVYRALTESERRGAFMKDALDSSEKAATSLAFQGSEKVIENCSLRKLLDRLYPAYTLLYELVKNQRN